jgi:hypothetical protein
MYGLYSYFFQRYKKWVKVNASIHRVEIIKKIEQDKKISSLAVYLTFTKGSISYYPVFTTDKVKNLKEKMNDTFITIYYNDENPNISYLSRPHFGLIRLLIGFIVFIFSLVYYADLINIKEYGFA